MTRPPSAPGRAPARDLPILERRGDVSSARFTAMGCPCEVLVATREPGRARRAVEAAADEARRIEHRYSRYRDDGVVHALNHAEGRPVTVDDETGRLLDYAASCHAMSDGRFDITTGALRRAWRFDGSEAEPDPEAIAEALACVGWQRVTWRDRTLTMPAGMEVDLGGIAKEYAVDRAVALAGEAGGRPVLVNFGGDIAVSGPRPGERAWQVGIADGSTDEDLAGEAIELSRGGLATSGDTRRFVTVGGRRLGHILDPRTGWPVEGAPRSVTVVAGTCLEAGTLSTLAVLHGPGAGEFLRAQGVLHRLSA